MSGINGDWYEALKGEFKKPYYKTLFNTVNEEYRTRQIFPPANDIFNAFHLTPLKDVKVVILGQDPYHEPGQANGLSFSVNPGVKLPPSLRNIFAELQSDCDITPPDSGDLTTWAKQGVFLLNSSLTVEAGKAASHKDFGWQTFTDAVVQRLAALPQPVAFVLWGAHAQKKAVIAARSPYPRLVLQAPHPSPLSAYRGFFGSRPFSQINAFLAQHGQKQIDWQP